MAKPLGNPFLPKPQGPQIPWPPHPNPPPSPKARETEPATRTHT